MTKEQASEILDTLLPKLQGGPGEAAHERNGAELFFRALATAGAFTDGADDAADERAAREAAAEYANKYPTVHRDVTVRRTDHGWVAYDWVARARIYPDAAEPLPEPSRPAANGASELTDAQMEEACAARLVMLSAIYKHHGDHDKARHYRDAANDIRRDGAVARGLASVEEAAKDWPDWKRKAADDEPCIGIPGPHPVAVGSKARAEEIARAAVPTDRPAPLRGALAAIEALDRAKAFPSEAALAEIDRLASKLLSEDLMPPDMRQAAIALATAVRKLGIGGE